MEGPRATRHGEGFDCQLERRKNKVTLSHLLSRAAESNFLPLGNLSAMDGRQMEPFFHESETGGLFFFDVESSSAAISFQGRSIEKNDVKLLLSVHFVFRCPMNCFRQHLWSHSACAKKDYWSISHYVHRFAKANTSSKPILASHGMRRFFRISSSSNATFQWAFPNMYTHTSHSLDHVQGSEPFRCLEHSQVSSRHYLYPSHKRCCLGLY